ncbi:MAG: zinc-dependent metalloprotease [Bacteroidota bacterium]
MTLRLLSLAAGLLVFAGCSATGPAAPTPPAAAAPDDDGETVAKATEGAERIDGLFPLFRDSTSGGLHMLVAPEQLEQEFVYVVHVTDGAPVGGHFRGQYRDNRVVTFRKVFDRIEVVAENTSFYFDPENDVSRAADANISPAILAVQKIVAEDSTGFLVEADPLFLSESLARIKPPNVPGRPPTAFRLGNLSREKTAVAAIRSYPENTDVVVRYVYDNPGALNGGGQAVTDGRSVAVSVQHSLVAMPESGAEPLIDDPRVGYFTTRVTDLTSGSVTPYRDLVHRWHLVKADPEAEVSDPVEPIVFWIENTTPRDLRPVIERAALQWNLAFEAAGISNAIEIREQPDDADWEAGDLRYNVLRWTSSPTPPFGGYGPSYVNPRTGQILGADIMLEYSAITGTGFAASVFDEAALGFVEAEADGGDLLGAGLPEADHRGCTLGPHLAREAALGLAMLEATGASEADVREHVEEFLHFLVLHEIGHTLGLNHNMRASQMLSPEQVHDEAYTERVGLMGSVMDYPAVNVAPEGVSQGEYWITRPGPYDTWAVAFAYADLTDAERAALLDRSTEPGLAFGNDADDMRAPGKSIDPRVMVGDMSSDAIGYATERLDLVRGLLGDLPEVYAGREGQSYEELRRTYLLLTGEMFSSSSVLSRYIGGVYVDRAFVGQPGADRPYRAVPLDDQKRAMDALATYVFAPDAFEMSEELLAALQPQRRGFDFLPTTEDPKIHARVLAMQRGVLAHLLHPNVVERITDSRLYGNEYVLADMMADLTDAVFEADAQGDVNTFRQNLQVEFVNGLARVIRNERSRYDYVAQSAALQSLRTVEDLLDDRRGGNAETMAHADLLALLIERALDDD